ncbi:MAG TPA: hypothetical protein VFX03_03560 [Thermomicrobiales bacterium]|nr:hypothetical protein [Thermomicrobiales bacterium]
MERERLDRIARIIAASAPRRTATRLTLGAALASVGLVGLGRDDDAGARKKRRKRCLKTARACTLTGRRCCGAPCGCPTGATTNCTCRSKTCIAAGQSGCQSDTDCCFGSCVSAGGPGSCLA